MEDTSDIVSRYTHTVENIHRIARECGRDPDDIQLLVVTKGHPVEKVQQVVEAGARTIGESYVQEAVEKRNAFGEHPEIQWHMIGHIQSRKSKDVAEYFDFIHSVDRIKIANQLSQHALQNDVCLPVLLECNLTGEESKYGWPFWNDLEWSQRFDEIRPLLDLKGITVQGLMTMPPYDPDPEHSRPVFQKLVALQERLMSQFPDQEWKHLSMGMSNDYPVAIQEGGTILRIGTTIMGPRTTSQ